MKTIWVHRELHESSSSSGNSIPLEKIRILRPLIHQSPKEGINKTTGKIQIINKIEENKSDLLLYQVNNIFVICFAYIIKLYWNEIIVILSLINIFPPCFWLTNHDYELGLAILLGSATVSDLSFDIVAYIAGFMGRKLVEKLDCYA